MALIKPCTCLAGDGPDEIWVKETGIPNGNVTVYCLNNILLVKYIEVTTTCTDWSLDLHSRGNGLPDDKVTAIATHCDRTTKFFLDIPYEDEQGLESIHLTFTNHGTGMVFWDVEIRGHKLGAGCCGCHIYTP